MFVSSLFLNKWSYICKKFVKVLFDHSYKICKAVWSIRGELLHWSVVCSKLSSPIHVYPCMRPSPRPPPVTSNSQCCTSNYYQTHFRYCNIFIFHFAPLYSTLWWREIKTCRTKTWRVNKKKHMQVQGGTSVVVPYCSCCLCLYFGSSIMLVTYFVNFR